ncbi:MAG: alpha-L-fucosidase [bacterium]
MRHVSVLLMIGLFLAGDLAFAQEGKYEPSWESIDSRPTPQWFNDAKFGIFIHWGVYAVPAWSPKGSYAEWYWNALLKPGAVQDFHNQTYGKAFKYQDFADMFKAELYDPDQWAKIFQKSGARYVVLTSKHHDGFCLWPSAESWNWNSVDVGPHRDLAGDLIQAVRKQGLKMGFYYSLYEWYHPLYRSNIERYVNEHMLPQMKDLAERYEPDLFWGDGEWEHPSSTWKSTEFLAWLLNESSCGKTVAINDRWGKETRGKHGGFYTTEYSKVHSDTVGRYEHSWEECRGMGASFGLNRNEDLADYKNAAELIHVLIETACNGGNLLLDIGPTGDGRIPVIMEERLLQIGEWLAVNGDAIYGTRAWRTTSDGEFVRYTCKNGAVYAICLKWPGKELILTAPECSSNTGVAMLGYEGNTRWEKADGKMKIYPPQLSVDDIPTPHAYVFKLTGVR